MKSVRIHSTGGADVLRVEELPPPTPGDREALVRIEAVGVNFIDVYQRSGQYPVALPYAIGLEASGTVAALGRGVSELRVGDRVAFCNSPGAYAELASVPVERLVALPAGLAARDAAASMLQGITAQFLVTSTYPLERGDTCLVHAAAGGVGLLLVQLAKLRGARVIATVSTDAKAELARGAGADEVIVYERSDFVAEVARLTERRGVQVVYDSVGKSTFLRGLDCLALRGTMVLYGQSSGAVDPIDPQLLSRKGSLFLTRPSMFHHTASRAELVQRATDVFTWIRDGALKLRIGLELPLERAADAHRALESRATTGKVLLVP